MTSSRSFSGNDARRLLRRARIATLATLNREGGTPYASLANVATDVDGAPIILVSSLAWHTRNLVADGRASLLVAEPAPEGDALTGARVTFIGRFRPADNPRLRRRYLAHHPEAEPYANFGDFGFWRLESEQIHAIAGFGRIETLSVGEVFPEATEMADLETRAVEHMNSDHGGAAQRLVTELLAAPAGNWQVAAIDPDGASLTCGERSLRLEFPAPVFDPESLSRGLAELLKKTHE